MNGDHSMRSAKSVKGSEDSATIAETPHHLLVTGGSRGIGAVIAKRLITVTGLHRRRLCRLTSLALVSNESTRLAVQREEICPLA